jgi:23S rRNA (cytidine1920-2'-O)/16S rRNA (cytidine1409-2'-O)-methyltransferase
VSRGGLKLDAALRRFDVEPSGAGALDVGASTGGFTDCLLVHGVEHVFAVDVGHGQLHPRLRADSRVTVLERTNVRELTPERLVDAAVVSEPGHDLAQRVPVDIVTADLSFISLVLVTSVLAGPVVRRGGAVVVLVKPQFEVGRVEASRARGVVRDPGLWRKTLGTVSAALESAGAAIMGAMPSPLTGTSGNTEFFLHAAVGPPSIGGAGATELLDAAVAEAAGPRP